MPDIIKNQVYALIDNSNRINKNSQMNAVGEVVSNLL